MASSVMMRLTTERSKVIFSDIMPMQALVAQAKALRWRRAQTLYFFGSLFVSFTYLIWLWISVKNIPVTTSGTYDTSGGLFQITTSGCNIAFRTDNAPTWTHEAVGGSYVAPSTTSYQATFVNAAGCQGRGKTCEGKCTVTIGVPPEAKDMTFKVGQDPSDDQKPVVSVGAGVTFANLNMGADHSPQPSVSLEIYSATITGLVDGWLSTGTFKAVNASIGDVNFVCETSSMWLLDHPINPSDIDIVYRAGGNSFCAAVDVVNPLDATFSPVTGQDNQGNAVDPGSGVSSGDINPLMHCNIGRAIVGSPQQVMYGADYTVQTTDPLQWFVDQYDPDGDNLVTRAEFINGLSGLGCCGPECPFESDCSAQAYEAGVADTQGTIGSGQVNVYTLAQNIINLGYYGWIPRCPTQVTLSVPSSALESPSGSMPSLLTNPTTRRISGLSAGGEVVVTLKMRAPLLPPLLEDQSVVGSVPSYGNYSAPGKLPGLRMLERDAAYMKRTYATTIGDLSSTEGDAYMQIDVVGGPGVPPTRWVYSTNPVYLAIHPAHLAFLSLNMLMPTMLRETVVMVDNGCSGLNGSMHDHHRNVSLAQISSQLKMSFKSNSKNLDGDLRGVLVLVNTSVASRSGSFQYMDVTFGADGQTPRIAEWTDDTLLVAVTWTIGLSLASGSIVAVMIVFVLFWTQVQRLLISRYMLRKTSRRKVELITGIPPTSQAPLFSLNGEDAMPTGQNPFAQALQLLHIFVIKPVEERYLDSVAFFFFHRVRKVPEESTRAPDGAFVSWDTMLQMYQAFCLKSDLKLESDDTVLYRKLVKQLNVRVTQTTVQGRLVGIKWKDSRGKKPYQILAGAPPKAMPQASTAEEEGELAWDVPTDSGSIGVNLNPSEPTDASTKEQILKAFLIDRCERCPTNFSSFFIDFETRPLEWLVDDHPGSRKGLKETLQEWCISKGITRVPDVADESIRWSEVLPRSAKMISNTPYRRVHGIQLTPSLDSTQVYWPFVLVRIYEAFVHVFCFVGAPMLIYEWVLQMQEMWAKHILPLAAQFNEFGSTGWLGNAVSPLGYSNALTPDFGLGYNYNVLLEFEVTAYATGLIVVLNIFRMALYYSPVSDSMHPAARLARETHGLALCLYCFALCIYVGCTVAWVLLAAMVRPVEYLTLATAFIVPILVAWNIIRSMETAAIRLHAQVKEVLGEKLQAKLRAALRRIEIEKLTLGNLGGKKGKGAAMSLEEKHKLEAAHALTHQERATGDEHDSGMNEVGPVDLFIALNTNGDASLSVAEIDEMWRVLDLGFTAEQQQSFFAYCDTNFTNTIESTEFEAGWDYVVDEFAQKCLRDAKLSTPHIFAACAVIVSYVLVLAVFVVVGIQSFTGAGSFGASLQSILIGGWGFAATKLRRPSEAENEKGLTSLVDKALQRYENVLKAEMRTAA